MISKKFLLFIHNSSVALQMVSLLKKDQIQKKNHKIVIVIENGLHNRELKKDICFIFQNFNFKLINVKIKKFSLFSLKNLFQWKKIFLNNNLNSKNLENNIKKKNIKLNNFDEIYYSNERSSKYINHIFPGKKIFFFHGIGDIYIFIKQNYIIELKNLLLNFLNYKFNKVELTKKNSPKASIFTNFIKSKYVKRNMIKINTNIYKSEFKKFSKKKIQEIKFQTKDDFYLYILKFPRFKVSNNNKDRTKYLIEYLNFQFMHVKNFINQDKLMKKYKLIIKTKDNVPVNEIKLVNLIAKKFFKNKIKFLTDKKNSQVNAEIFASHHKCKGIISITSTLDFLVKIINSKIKILQYTQIVKKFNKKNKFYTKKNVDIKNSKLNEYYKMDQFINI